jgi:hypothetical protein
MNTKPAAQVISLNARKIDKLHERVERGKQIRIRIGQLLIEQKTLHPDTFTAWVETNFDFDLATANKYMKEAR